MNQNDIFILEKWSSTWDGWMKVMSVSFMQRASLRGKDTFLENFWFFFQPSSENFIRCYSDIKIYPQK